MYEKIWSYFLSLPILAHADLPLTVESLVANKHKITLETSLVYGNTKSKDTEMVGYIPVQINTNTYVNLSTEFENQKTQQEYLIANFGVKYGVSDKADIGINISGFYDTQKKPNL